MPLDGDDWRTRLRLISGCVTAQRPLIRQQDGILGQMQVAFFSSPAPLRIPGALSGSRLAVRMALSDAAHRRDIPNVVGYAIALEDRDGIELLAFHRHLPGARGEPRRPHVHVSAAPRPRQANGERGLVPLDKRHLPTGPVSLADVVAMLIEEFGAEPLVPDWRERLAMANPA